MSDTATQVDNATKTEPDKVKDPEVKLEHLAQLKRELLEEIGSLHAKDNEEKQALKVQVTALQDYIDELEKAKANQDKIKADDTTMVLPPADIPIQQPNVASGDQVAPSSGGSSETPRKKRMKWY